MAFILCQSQTSLILMIMYTIIVIVVVVSHFLSLVSNNQKVPLCLIADSKQCWLLRSSNQPLLRGHRDPSQACTHLAYWPTFTYGWRLESGMPAPARTPNYAATTQSRVRRSSLRSRSPPVISITCTKIGVCHYESCSRGIMEWLGFKLATSPTELTHPPTDDTMIEAGTAIETVGHTSTIQTTNKKNTHLHKEHNTQTHT